ncbi:MAG: hypothetical protein JST21_06690 [Bacteroidetes bacterium]|nr:hypothetical protein [Bacteroidota bacterium]
MQFTTTSYLKNLKILFVALGAVQIFLALIVFVLISNGISLNGEDLVQGFNYLIPALCVAMVFLSLVIFRKKINTIDSIFSLKDKLEVYRGLYITRWAMIEGPVIFTLIAYLLTGAEKFLIIVVVMLLIYISLYPSLQKILKELPLSSDEQEILNDPNGIIE